MATRVDAIAHNDKLQRSNELQELRKLKLAKNFKKQRSALIKQNLNDQQKSARNWSRNQASEASSSSTSKAAKSSSVYIGDSWAMQQKARAEEEKRKRQEAESFLRGYRPNTHVPSSPGKPGDRGTDEYKSSYGGELNDFAMRQKALADEERRKRMEAESYLRTYKYMGGAEKLDGSTVENLSPSTSWDNEKKEPDDRSPSSKRVGGIIKFFSNRKSRGNSDTIVAKGKKYRGGYSSVPSTKELEKRTDIEEFSPTSVMVDDFRSQDEQRTSNDESFPSVHQLRLEFDREKEERLSLLKTKQKTFPQELSKANISSTSVSKHKAAVQNWDLDILLEFESNEKKEESSKPDLVNETWKIHLIFTIYYSSKRINKVSSKLSHVKKTFEKKFADAGTTMIESVLGECVNENFTYEITNFSSRAMNSNVMASLGKKDPIKVLVQTSLSVNRGKNGNDQMLEKIISEGFRGAASQTAFVILEDLQ